MGPSGSPTAEVWAAADAAVRRGQHLALTTARGAFGPTYDYAQRLDPAGWHIFHAGAALVHTGTGDVKEHQLPQHVVDRAAAAADTHGWVFEYYAATDYTVNSTDPLAVEHAELVGTPYVQRTPDTLDGAVVRVQFVVPHREVGAIRSAMGDAACVTEAHSPVMQGISFVSVTANGITKATAIADIAEALGIDMGHIMMVGDGDNDIEAVRAVGHGTAMGNAVAELKDVARHHVGHVVDNGLADALELSARL